MRTVLAVATLLGTVGVVASFSLFYLAYRVFFIGTLVVQSMMYLKLSVAGHFMIFVARTRGPFLIVSARHYPNRSGPWHSVYGDTHRRLRGVSGAHRVDARVNCLGVRTRLVPYHRRVESAFLSTRLGAKQQANARARRLRTWLELKPLKKMSRVGFSRQAL
jgi:hypothetical protein